MDEQSLNAVSLEIVEAAIEIHRTVGPGLLESVYRSCMIYELRERGLTVMAEQFVAVRYKKLVLDASYRIDLLVEGAVIVELKSVETVLLVHHAQLLSYLRLMNRRLGLLLNSTFQYL